MLLVKSEDYGAFRDSELFLHWRLLQPVWKSSRGAGPTELTGREMLLGVAQKPEQSFRNGRVFLWGFEVLFCGFFLLSLLK